MKLAISYAFDDEPTAREIGSLCDELGIEHLLDGRSDWLMHGLHDGPEGPTHQVVVISSSTEGCWWMLFRLGRAAEKGIAILAYLADSGQQPAELPRDTECVRGLVGFREWLLSRSARG